MAGPSGSTPILALPYPIPDDTVDVPRDVQALATALDSRYGGGGAGGGGALKQAPVLDVGMAGQIRAGRQLTLADFTSLGLNAPVGLWNLSNLNDSSGNSRNLANKGSVPFGVGINGQASTAAVFAGSTGQALYISDTGAADPFRISTGSWGCWSRTAKRGTAQVALSKLRGPSTLSWQSYVDTTNVVSTTLSADGTNAFVLSGVSDVADDRWHFFVVTVDGTQGRIYIDGVLEGSTSFGALFSTSAPLNIGSNAADAGTAASSPFYGRVDEAFVTADVLSDDQVRALYCARIPHGYATTPTRVNLNVRRRRRGGTLATTDFPTQPLRLYNFDYTGGAGWGDQGSNGVTLTPPGQAYGAAGADGRFNQAMGVTASVGAAATDAGLPSGTATRSYGAWFKCTAATETIISWGTITTADVRLRVPSGNLSCNNGGDAIVGPYAADGQWHFAVMVEDNAAGDGVRRKMYMDGRLVGSSTVLNAITNPGSTNFRIGSAPNGTLPFVGQIDGAFVCGYALTFEQQAALYAKGSQALPPSPKNAGDHVESMDATNVLATFDTLDTTALVDMGVEA